MEVGLGYLSQERVELQEVTIERQNSRTHIWYFPECKKKNEVARVKQETIKATSKFDDIKILNSQVNKDK